MTIECDVSLWYLVTLQCSDICGIESKISTSKKSINVKRIKSNLVTMPSVLILILKTKMTPTLQYWSNWRSWFEWTYQNRKIFVCRKSESIVRSIYQWNEPIYRKLVHSSSLLDVTELAAQGKLSLILSRTLEHVGNTKVMQNWKGNSHVCDASLANQDLTKVDTLESSCYF